MRLTKLSSCYFITLSVTIAAVFGMALFDAAMAERLGHDSSGFSAVGPYETAFDWTAVLHSFTTIALIGPTTLIATLMVRRSNLLNTELQTLLNRDRLTDAATRDYFFSKIAENPNGYGISLMVDIDHFKQVNDTYGHLAGDAVIQKVAQVLRHQTRKQDIVCRFGGEEFVIFLQSATPAKGWEIAERIRAGIESTETISSAGAIKVTVSVGGSLKDRIDEIDEAIGRADDCLYRAKAAGRNRTEVDWWSTEDAQLARAS